MRVPQFWRLAKHNYQLTGSRCPQCGASVLPSRPVCAACASQQDAILIVFDPLPISAPRPARGAGHEREASLWMRG